MGDVEVKDIPDQELVKMNANTIRWYIGTAKNQDGIAIFEKLRWMVLKYTNKLKSDDQPKPVHTKGGLDAFF